ncbi:protein of unknown function [Hyphomicrobium sp. MC1]|nr:protein of unknown function [Hyphomicrobium sp. MC1]
MSALSCYMGQAALTGTNRELYQYGIVKGFVRHYPKYPLVGTCDDAILLTLESLLVRIDP